MNSWICEYILIYLLFKQLPTFQSWRLNFCHRHQIAVGDMTFISYILIVFCEVEFWRSFEKLLKWRWDGCVGKSTMWFIVGMSSSFRKAYTEYQTRSDSSGSSLLAQYRHLQQRRQGAARIRRGEARRTSTPNPANIPITCARCQTTDAREWPSLFLHGPLS